MAKHRLQFDFDEVAVQEIDALREKTGLPNRAELVRHALRFLDWTCDEIATGAKLLIEKNGQAREIIFPFWHCDSSKKPS